ncbi:MAG: DMT family transporter [Dongiaceae bacterium]
MLAVVVATLSYGSITTLSRLAYDDGTTAITIVAIRNAFFVLGFGAWLIAMRGGLVLPRRVWYASLFLGLLMALWGYGYMASVAYIPVSLAALLYFTFPLLVGVIAAVTGQERMTLIRALALLIAFAGLALALGPAWDGLDWRGVALVMMGSVTCAIAHVFIAPIFRDYDIIAISFLAHLWMVIGFAIYGIAMHDFALPRSTKGQFIVIAVVLFYILAYTLWSIAIRWIGPVRTAGMMNLEPIVSVAAAALILGERLAPVQLAGGALVLLALMIVARHRGASRSTALVVTPQR